MSKYFIWLLLVLFASTAISTPIKSTKVVFHCENDFQLNDTFCGYNISEEINLMKKSNISSQPENISEYEQEMKDQQDRKEKLRNLKRKFERQRDSNNIELSKSTYPEQRSNSEIHHYYPRESNSKADLSFKNGCYRTSVREKPLFYELKWHFNTEKWNCVEQQTSTDGYIERANLFKSPLKFLIFTIS